MIIVIGVIASVVIAGGHAWSMHTQNLRWVTWANIVGFIPAALCALSAGTAGFPAAFLSIWFGLWSIYGLWREKRSESHTEVLQETVETPTRLVMNPATYAVLKERFMEHEPYAGLASSCGLGSVPVSTSQFLRDGEMFAFRTDPTEWIMKND